MARAMVYKGCVSWWCSESWRVMQRAGQHPYDAAVDPGVSETERVRSWSVSARGSMGLGPIGAAGSVPRVLES